MHIRERQGGHWRRKCTAAAGEAVRQQEGETQCAIKTATVWTTHGPEDAPTEECVFETPEWQNSSIPHRQTWQRGEHLMRGACVSEI